MNTTQKTKGWETRTPQNTRVNSVVPVGWAAHAPLVTPVVLH